MVLPEGQHYLKWRVPGGEVRTDPVEFSPYLVLGLDIGIASCGWALLDTANKQVVDMGVHLWDVPQEDKTKTSLAKKRRAARSMRRNIRRSSDRMKHCLELFKRHGLVPQDAQKAWMQTVKGDRQPLESRVEALDANVSDRALAQALYNICNRRGYIPHGEGGADGDVEGRKVLAALEENSKVMEENGYRTVGEMMLREGQKQGCSNGQSRNKGGDYSRCVRMSQLLEEVNAIFEAQRNLGNAAATEDLQEEFIDCLTWEKSSADHDEHVYSTVAFCTYFADKGIKAAAKACLSFEICTAYERVNNVRIVNSRGDEEPLPPEIKRWCIATLFSPVPVKGNKECKIRYSDIRKKLDLSAHYSFKGIDADKEKIREVSEPKVWRLERKQLPQGLLNRMAANLEFADAIDSALAYSSSLESLEGQLEPLDLSDDEFKAVCSLSFNSKLFSGYGTRSAEALRILIDAFEDVENISGLPEAEEATGLLAKRTESVERGTALPDYKLYDPTNNNPVVLRVMARVRKVVNAVIREYGMPNIVRVELARELKHSAKEKKGIEKANRDREKTNKAARKCVAELRQCAEDDVPGKLIRMWLLYEEQDKVDLYTGEAIDPHRLVNDANYCQVDHILPYSRTCDDSYNNKVLVFTKSNQEKKERSPYEWLEPQGKWKEFSGRIDAMRQSGYPFKKAQKLLEQDLESKTAEFIQRNLNDTRYATRAALSYIDTYLAFPEGDEKRHTYAVAGGATSALRGAWGFSGKDRNADDCHHAVDAAIIAACDQSTVIKVTKASEKKLLTRKEDRKTLFEGTAPWEGFAQEVEERYGKLVPTRRVEHGASARLFEDTVYSFVGMNDKGNKAILKASGKEKVAGNFIVRDDGSVVKPDGMMMLRLWWDGKKYLKEPVYYADLDAMRHGEYIPRYFDTKRPRAMWPPVPDSVLKGEPVILRYGTCVSVGGESLRYKCFDVANGSLKFASLKKHSTEVLPKLSLGKAKAASFLQAIHEDILGLCHKTESEE